MSEGIFAGSLMFFFRSSIVTTYKHGNLEQVFFFSGSKTLLNLFISVDFLYCTNHQIHRINGFIVDSVQVHSK